MAPEQGTPPPLGMDPVDAAQAYRMAVMAQNKSKAPPRPWMWTLSNNPCWEGGGAGENENPDWGIAHSRVCFPGAPLLPYDTHTHTHTIRAKGLKRLFHVIARDTLECTNTLA